MATHYEKVTAGLFLLMGIALILVVLFLIVGIKMTQGVDSYYISFSGSIGNLKQGSPVKFMGVPVGSVNSLSLSKDLSAIEAKIDLSRGTRITTGTRAKLKFSPLTNVYFIELTVTEGELGADLYPGCMIPHEKTGVDEFVSNLPELQETILSVLAKASVAMSDENLDNLKVFMNDTRDLIGFLRQDYPVLKKDLETTVEAMRTSLKNFDITLEKFRNEAKRFTTDTRGAFDKGVGTVKGGIDRFNTTIEDLELKSQVTDVRQAVERLVADLEQAAQQMEQMVTENRGEMKLLLKGLNDLSLQIKGFVAKLDRDPSSLIWSNSKSERSTPD